jgi:hypothetical protein
VLGFGLLPVLSTVTTASRHERNVGNLKQLVAGTLQYAADNNGRLPLAFSQRPDGTWRWNTLIPIPAGWRNPPLPGNGSEWPNSVQPYFVNWSLLEIAGLPASRVYPDADYQNANFPWARTSVMMNGLLHQYPVSSVVEPGRLPLLWTGSGRVRIEGASIASPSLRCDTTAPCIYTPGSNTPSGGWSVPVLTSMYVEERSVYLATVDGSVRLSKTGTGTAPTTTGDPNTDVLASVYPDGKPYAMWFDQYGHAWLFRPDFNFGQ